MTDRLHAGESPPKLEKAKDTVPAGPGTDGKLPASSGATVAIPRETATANQLTDEEQMALFEKELKENDWGHQPC